MKARSLRRALKLAFLMAFLAMLTLHPGPTTGNASPSVSASDSISSPRIRAFARQLDSVGNAAIASFEEELSRQGTPLVEPHPVHPDRALVTFVWFSDAPRRNVVVQGWLESRDVTKRAMAPLAGEAVWYRTFEAPGDLTMGYLISPDDPRLIDGESADFDTLVEGWLTDPLNPRVQRGALGIDWSVVDLSPHDGPAWPENGVTVPPERIERLSIVSEHMDITVPVTVYLPDTEAAELPLLMFFDGYGFYDIDRVHELAEELITSGGMEPALIAFIYNPDGTRNRDMSCHPPTHRFLRDELLPLLRSRYGAGLDPAETALAGRSRSGLGAACAAFMMPETIGNVISQSGAFWWAPEGEEYEWLARRLASESTRSIRFYLDAGLLEGGPNPDTGLSMLTVTRHLRDVARAKGYSVAYREFSGGHDPIGWRTTLPSALLHFFGKDGG